MPDRHLAGSPRPPKGTTMRIRNSRPDTSALRELGLDTVLARHELEQLARDADVIDVAAGEPLCRSGAPARQFIGILDGYVDVCDDDGNRRIAGPGTRIGGIEVLEARCHVETVVARSACRLVVIFGPALRRTQPSGAVAAWLDAVVTASEQLALVG
jgi:CRP-like cAMP-binding protein